MYPDLATWEMVPILLGWLNIAESHYSLHSPKMSLSHMYEGNPKDKVPYFWLTKQLFFNNLYIFLKAEHLPIFLHDHHFGRCIFLDAIEAFVRPCHTSSPPCPWGISEPLLSPRHKGWIAFLSMFFQLREQVIVTGCQVQTIS